MYKETAKKVLEYIENSVTAFHAVENLSRELDYMEFQPLDEKTCWNLKKGGKYYVVRNGSSIISFTIPKDEPKGFHVIASHTDSPCPKVKPNPELKGAGFTVKLNVEKYGGMINSTWFDRPLSVGGRVVFMEGNELKSRLVKFDRNLLMIPSLAIHMDREANSGHAINPQKEMLPIFCQPVIMDAPAKYDGLMQLIADKLEIHEEAIIDSDLYVYNPMKPTFWGANEEFIAAPRIDNLESCYSTFLGFLEAGEIKDGESLNGGYINVHAVFDNEEVGSLTRQGADSTFMAEVFERIALSLGKNREEFFAMVSSSFMLSADNAHAVHPNYDEKADPVNRPAMNRGVVIKYAGNQKYTTDGMSGAEVIKLCMTNDIPFQRFTNRSDMAGGSTLGNLAQAHLSMKTADIGLPQLSMHSACESAGAYDPEAMKKLAKAFYEMRS